MSDLDRQVEQVGRDLLKLLALELDPPFEPGERKREGYLLLDVSDFLAISPLVRSSWWANGSVSGLTPFSSSNFAAR